MAWTNLKLSDIGPKAGWAIVHSTYPVPISYVPFKQIFWLLQLELQLSALILKLSFSY